MPKPSRLAGMVMVETQPVCNPKYMLEKQMMVPTARPTRTPRTVREWPWIVGGVGLGAVRGCGLGWSGAESIEEEEEEGEGGRRRGV